MFLVSDMAEAEKEAVDGWGRLAVIIIQDHPVMAYEEEDHLVLRHKNQDMYLGGDRISNRVQGMIFQIFFKMLIQLLVCP